MIWCGTPRHRKHAPSRSEATWLSRSAASAHLHSKTDGTGRQRPLSIPTMHDRAMQALYLLALDPIAETWAIRIPTDFAPSDPRRMPLSNASTSSHARMRRRGFWRATSAPVSTASATHGSWPTFRWIKPCSKWLTAGFVEKQRLYPTEAGVPQAFAPVIANLTLDGLEQLLRVHYPPNTKRAQRAKVNLVRYCDDFIIWGSSQAVLEQEVNRWWNTFSTNVV